LTWLANLVGSASGRSIDGAGGIGGLLTCYDAQTTKRYYYLHATRQLRAVKA
jgi:hypothetical protein